MSTENQTATPAKKAASKKKATAKGGKAVLAAAKKVKSPVKKGGGNAKAAPKKKGEGKIAQIITLHLKGKTNKEIIEAGYSKSTVSIQVAKYKRENAK